MPVAKRCAREAMLPEHIECCGLSGARGFNFPELTQSAVGPLTEQIPTGCTRGLQQQPYLRDRFERYGRFRVLFHLLPRGRRFALGAVTRWTRKTD